MMVKSGLDFFFFKFTEPLQSCCCPVQKNLPRMAELTWQVSLKGLGEFQNKKFLTTFHHHFYVKNGNFKTQNFSPLIERVLAGVRLFMR